MPSGPVSSWLEDLSQYHMAIQHRIGRRHCNADALSPLPVPLWGCVTRFDVHPSDLPCGVCPTCRRTHENWNALGQTGLLIVPGYGRCHNPGTSEAVVGSEETTASPDEKSVTRQPSISEVAWGIPQKACLTALPLHTHGAGFLGAVTSGGAVSYPALA